MSFKKKPRSWRIVLGISIILFSLLLTHVIDVHYFWSGLLMAFGIIQFTSGFLMTHKEQTKSNIKTRKLYNR